MFEVETPSVRRARFRSRGLGVDARWAVVEGTPGFFAVTKRVHNRPHGAVVECGALDDRARPGYERVLADNLPTISKRVRLIRCVLERSGVRATA